MPYQFQKDTVSSEFGGSCFQLWCLLWVLLATLMEWLNVITFDQASSFRLINRLPLQLLRGFGFFIFCAEDNIKKAKMLFGLLLSAFGVASKLVEYG